MLKGLDITCFLLDNFVTRILKLHFMKEPVPSDLPPTPFLGHLKEQMGSPYSTRKTIHMIRNPEEIHNAKAQREEGDMDVGWDISSKDVERLRQFLTPTYTLLPNLEPIVQPYIPLGPVHDKDKIVREKEQDYDIPLNDSIMQPLTPQTVYITPHDDDYVAPATNPLSNKQLNKSEERNFLILQSFICVSGENNETLSLGRKNGSRFRKMIMEEMEEVLRNNGEDSDNKT
ncbi:hypothetical protein Tco_0551243 [Tanacetum coccineum]